MLKAVVLFVVMTTPALALDVGGIGHDAIGAAHDAVGGALGGAGGTARGATGSVGGAVSGVGSSVGGAASSSGTGQRGPSSTGSTSPGAQAAPSIGGKSYGITGRSVVSKSPPKSSITAVRMWLYSRRGVEELPSQIAGLEGWLRTAITLARPAAVAVLVRDCHRFLQPVSRAPRWRRQACIIIRDQTRFLGQW